MEKYIHAKVYDDGGTFIYTKERFESKVFENGPDAILYLQKKGFRLVAVDRGELWFVKKVIDLSDEL